MKGPHKKFGYFLSISQQAVFADITKNSAVGNIIMKYLYHEYLNKHIYITRKGFETCVRQETAHLATLKSKKYIS
jgi:hypothetical protein